jgi:DNA-binding response OmpR family regulator
VACILVVDDDTAVRDSLHAILSLRGYDIRQAKDGWECEKAVRHGVPDLVILDIMMPEQEGMATIRSLRRSHPALKILAISGGGEMHLREALSFAEALGAHASLAKPFLARDLLAAIDTLIGH